MGKHSVKMPKELTSANGGKALMIGEFFEVIEVPNEEFCGCEECDYCEMNPDQEEYHLQKVQVGWDTIKKIYKRAVDHFGS